MEKAVTMSLSTLNDDHIKLEAIRLQAEGSNVSEIAKAVATTERNVKRFLAMQTYTGWWAKYTKPVAGGVMRDHHKEASVASGNRFIITSAQNNTYVHRSFLKSLEVMAKEKGAQIIVGTFSYNKSGFQNLEKDQSEFFDPLIVPYILSEPVKLADDLIYCGELNILPTAVSPLSDLYSYTKSSSGIIPHAKMQLESYPSPKGKPARMLYTTGAVTQRNYIEKKAGQKASFHHIFGALFVEVADDGEWFVRQITAETGTGNFYDLDVYYTPEGSVRTSRVEAIQWGDIHAERLDQSAALAAFINPSKCMLDVLKPKYQFVHDVCDFTARNHHTINDPYIRFQSYHNKTDLVEDDIKQVCEVLRMMHRPSVQTIVVESNHDLALKRWLKTADYKQDPANAILFLTLQLKQYLAMKNRVKDFSLLQYAVNLFDSDLNKIKFLSTDESFTICGDHGIECGAHGDKGANGSKGTAQTFRRLGVRHNIGHSHTARIIDGVYQAGTMSKLDLGYNEGGSSWSHSCIVTYPNGKRTIVTIKKGKWRA